MLEELDIKPGNLRGSQLGAIGQHDDLDDERLEPLAKLAVDANLGAKEIKALGVDVRRAGSDDDAERIVKQSRESNAARIKEVEKGGSGKPPAAKGLRQHLGFVDRPQRRVDGRDEPERDGGPPHARCRLD